MTSRDLTRSLSHDQQEELIADVTCAVYQIALSEARNLNWLDLQLALWRVVRSRLEAWGPNDGDIPLHDCRRNREFEVITASISDAGHHACPVCIGSR